MAGKVINIKGCSPLKLYRGLTGNYLKSPKKLSKTIMRNLIKGHRPEIE